MPQQLFEELAKTLKEVRVLEDLVCLLESHKRLVAGLSGIAYMSRLGSTAVEFMGYLSLPTRFDGGSLACYCDSTYYIHVHLPTQQPRYFAILKLNPPHILGRSWVQVPTLKCRGIRIIHKLPVPMCHCRVLTRSSIDITSNVTVLAINQ